MISTIPQLPKYFTIESKIGEGTFSKVYKARLNGTDKYFALKYIIPTMKPSRIESELQFLRKYGGSHNVCHVESAIVSSGHTVLVMPYFAHDRFNDYMSLMSIDEVRLYMKNLLLALSKIHSHRIIHRDIKPNNFLYNRSSKQFLLVDFGLAQKVDQVDRKGPPPSRRLTLKESTNLHPPALSSNQRAVLNGLSQVVGKPESKQLVINRKRTTEMHDRTDSKRSKNNDSHAVPTESSVFNTPVTPSNAVVSPSDLTKVPASSSLNGPAAVDIHGFKTPTKTPIKSSIPQPIAMPETPLKSNRLTGKRSAAKRLITYDESPKSRLNDSCANIYCDCFQKAQVCKICIRRSDMYAPRAGTAGFRAPEVLLKSAEQSTAIDIWSAGVIFISLLSGRYPFFRNSDDMTSLAEIVTLLGSKRVIRAAKKLGKSLLVESPDKLPLDLKFTCEALRANGSNVLKDVPDSAYELLDGLLDPYPLKRLTAEQALKHPFIVGVPGEENKLESN